MSWQHNTTDMLRLLERGPWDRDGSGMYVEGVGVRFAQGRI